MRPTFVCRWSGCPHLSLRLSATIAHAAIMLSSTFVIGVRGDVDVSGYEAATDGIPYTRNVGRTHRIVSAVLLTVLTGLPVSGSVCALVCAGATPSASHHHHAGGMSEATTADCHHSTPDGPAIGAVDSHDCSTHDGILRVAAASPAAARADAGDASTSQDLVPAVTARFSLVSSHIHWADSPPSGNALSSSFALVLRI